MKFQYPRPPSPYCLTSPNFAKLERTSSNHTSCTAPSIPVYENHGVCAGSSKKISLPVSNASCAAASFPSVAARVSPASYGSVQSYA